MTLRQWPYVAGFLLSVASSGACDHATTTPGANEVPGSPRTGNRGIIEVKAKARPPGQPVTRFGVQVEHDLSGVEAEVVVRLAAVGLEHDPMFSRMVRGLALSSPSRFDLPPGLVDGLLVWNGLHDPPPRVVIVEIPGDSDRCEDRSDGPCAEPVAALIDEVRGSLGAVGPQRFGVGIVRTPLGATRMVVGLSERMFQLEPTPVSVAHGSKIEVQGKLSGSRTEPRIEVTDPRGSWAKTPSVIGNDGSLRARVDCRIRGLYKIEVLATGAHGPEVVANFPVFCGAPVPTEIVYRYERLGLDVAADDVIRIAFAELNEARERRGLPILSWDARAASVAEAHSSDMATHGFVGHVSPRTGDVTRRFRAAKIGGSVLRENVARGYGPRSIHESLMASPGHRVNCLADDVTRVGIGVVFGQPETDAVGAPRPLFLTQNFFADSSVDVVPRNLAQVVRRKVDDTLARESLPRVAWHPQLGALAQARADAIAGSGTTLSDDEFGERVFKLGFAKASRHQVNAMAWEQLGSVEIWRDIRGHRIGLGIAAVPVTRGGGFVMVIVSAEAPV